MKYRNKDIGDLFANKNWEGVKPFLDKFGLDPLILLDKIVGERDWEKLKEFVKRFSMEPVMEYGLPVGEGVKELYQISDRHHAHKHKTGAEWWLRDETNDLIRQVKGHATEPMFQEKVAMLWKEVDSQLDGEQRVKANAFRKILMTVLVQAICGLAIDEEQQAMKKIQEILEKHGFSSGLEYRDEFAE